LINRKRYKKKTPFNNLYKLVTNTLYGDMTSKFFMTANTTVGNNITARCRAMAWYMEKGLNGFQSVTDGTAFDMNAVVYSLRGRNINASQLQDLSTLTSREVYNREIVLKPIGEYVGYEIKLYAGCDISSKKVKTIRHLTCHCEDGSVLVMQDESWRKWLDAAIVTHLQSIFPNVDVLNAPATTIQVEANVKTNELVSVAFTPRKGQFIIECKDLYTGITCHGASNYALHENQQLACKMRSYSDTNHDSFDNTLERTTDEANPGKDFLTHLTRSSCSLPSQQPFLKRKIIKLKDYQQRQPHYNNLGLNIGDNAVEPGLLRPFSLSQFTFQTLKQMKSWEKDVDADKEKFGWSLERYFINDDGTLDFEAMVCTVNELIKNGVMHYRDWFNKQKKSIDAQHEFKETLEEIRKRVKSKPVQTKVQ
jgi:hypothetical protein